MASTFPPLNALRVFEVAARKLSFSRAAEELCVTQGAVSKQIQALEQYLEQPLFERTPAGLVLTEAGRQYLPEISNALEQIQSATARLQHQSTADKTLLLNLTPSFSTLWLIPRLAELATACPDLRLNMVSGDGAFRFQNSDADAAIRCLPLSLSHEHSNLLIEEVLVPVVHPALLEQQPIETPVDLLKHPLLMHNTRPQLWRQFLREVIPAGEPAMPLRVRHSFEHFYMSLEAAHQQLGIALIPAFMAADHLRNSELVTPLGLRYQSGYGFYFLVPPYRPRSEQVKQLRAWLQQALAQTQHDILSY